jgi:hypothetical protein
MKVLQGYLINLHPLFKTLLYLQLLAVAIWGPLLSVIGVSVVCFAYLIFWPDEQGLASPYYALVFCAVAVLVVLPGGSRGELIQALRLSARLFDVMVVSYMLGVVLRPIDVAQLGTLLRLPSNIIMVMIGVASFVPLASRSIHNVIFAQRSRGFEFTFLSLFRPTTYRVLVVPYVVSILRSAMDKWVSMNLRPWTGYKLPIRKIAIYEIALFLISFGLWFH